MAANVFLKMSDPAIAGEATDPRHIDEIQILSWSHSFNQPTKPTKIEDELPEQANHADFNFSKYLDTATDDLLKSCWNGKPIGRAVMTCYRSDGADDAAPYLVVSLDNVIVSNISIGGGPGDLPTENVALAYGKISYRYQSQRLENGDEVAEAVSHDLIARVVH